MMGRSKGKNKSKEGFELDYDQPLRQAFGGRYESCFILFHPFLRFPAEAQKEFHPMTSKDFQKKIEGMDEEGRAEVVASLNNPDLEEMYYHAKPISWKEAATSFGLDSPEKVNNLLQANNYDETIEEEFVTEEENQNFSLDYYKAFVDLWEPTTHSFQPSHFEAIIDSFVQAREREIHGSDALQTDVVIETETATDYEESMLEFFEALTHGKGAIYPASMDFLFYLENDQFFTLLFGPETFITETVRKHQLEGFFCEEDTMFSWSTYKTLEEVQALDFSWKNIGKIIFDRKDIPAILKYAVALVIIVNIGNLLEGGSSYLWLGIWEDFDTIQQYPFGAEGPVAGVWAYESHIHYVKSFLPALFFSILQLGLLSVYFFKRSKSLLRGTLASTLLIWPLFQFAEPIWNFLDSHFPALYPFLTLH